MNISYIKDQVEEFAFRIATEVFERHDDLYREAEQRAVELGYHADDDVDGIEEQLGDVLWELIRERIKG